MLCRTHIGVYAAVFQGRSLLLVKKSRGPYIGKLDLPGGKIERGESIDECLSRELFEESGMKMEHSSILMNQSIVVDYEEAEGLCVSLHHIGLIYRVEVFEGDPIESMNTEDSLGAQWYPLDKLIIHALSPFAAEVVKLMSGEARR